MNSPDSPPLPPLPLPTDACNLSAAQRSEMLLAAREVQECYRVLKKADLNVVGEVLRGQGEFIELEHYPQDDVFDDENHSQYYYHAHRPEEHGHFHTFLRTGSLPGEAQPLLAMQDQTPWPLGDEANAHLISISMDEWGYPIGLFATNRWVTNETWYAANSVIDMLPQFQIDHAWPSWPVNRWISAMLRLFRPHVTALLTHRDHVIDLWRQTHPATDVLEDRRLEITGYMAISVDEWTAALEAAGQNDKSAQSTA